MSAHQAACKIISSRLDPSGEHSSSGLIGRTAAEVISALAITADHKQMLRDADSLSRVANATIGPATQPEGRCAEHIVALLAEVAHLQPALTPRHEAPAEGAGEALKPYLSLINSTPDLLSLLYDADMLPEQTVTMRGAVSVAAVCEAYQAGLRARSSAPEAREERWPLKARVWFRESTNEKVLEIEGAIGEVFGIWRHTQPAGTPDDEVPGLLSLYTHPAAPSADKLRSEDQ